MTTKDLTVRIGQEEIGHILNRKENLDHHDQLWDFLSRYLALGWDPAVTTAEGGADLGLDLKQPREDWWKQLADLGLEGIQLNLSIRTGRASRLLVLEVNKGEGTLSLDLLGDWRSQCVAELGNSREQHYYALPSDHQTPSSFFMAKEVLIYGESGLILAPPSVELEAKEPWRWLKPPWENPPQPPPPAVWRFIREQQNPGAAKEERDLPPWEEVFRIVAAHEAVLKTLLMPPTEMNRYYGDILAAARAGGLNDRQLLLGLLWHAPHGDARHNGERWQSLQRLLASDFSGVASPPVPSPWGGGAPPGGAWPGVPTPGVPGLASPLLESLDLNLGVGELTRQLLGEQESEPSGPKFEKTVSGQFFQLLAALGEKVISESCRNEALLSGMEAQATELERLVSEIEHCLVPPAPPGGGDSKTHPRPPGAGGAMEFPWPGAMNPQRRKTKKLQEVKAMVQDFLSKNPDLAGDQSKVQMVLFCLKNYVSINPDYAGLSFRDKLEKAGQMARSFLGQPQPPEPGR